MKWIWTIEYRVFGVDKSIGEATFELGPQGKGVQGSEVENSKLHKNYKLMIGNGVFEDDESIGDKILGSGPLGYGVTRNKNSKLIHMYMIYRK